MKYVTRYKCRIVQVLHFPPRVSHNLEGPLSLSL